MLEEIIRRYIESESDIITANIFKYTWRGGDFESGNLDRLQHIRDAIRALIKEHNIFSRHAIDEMQIYQNRLLGKINRESNQ